MKPKMTKEEFTELLNSFQSGGSTILKHMAVRMVTSNSMYNGYLEDIPDYMKKSLMRKVLRFVAETSLKGTFEIDGLSTSCAFYAMEDGYPVSFGSNTEWSFYSNVLGKTIYVEVKNNKARYYNEEHLCLGTMDVSNVHINTISGKVDIVKDFERSMQTIKNWAKS